MIISQVMITDHIWLEMTRFKKNQSERFCTLTTRWHPAT